MVEPDPARNEGWLAAVWHALRIDGRQRGLVGVLPLVLTGLAVAALASGVLRPLDLRFFDLVTRHESGDPPRVVIVKPDAAFAAQGPGGNAQITRAALQLGARRVAFRADPGFDPVRDGLPAGKIVVARSALRIAGSKRWQFTGRVPPTGFVIGARVLARQEEGMGRRQLAWLPGPKGQIAVFESAAAGRRLLAPDYLVRLSLQQNFPRITARQLVSGEIGRDVLSGVVVLVEPGEGAAEPDVVTALSRGGRVISRTQFSAAAIQGLMTGRTVQELPLRWSILLLAFAGIALAILLLRFDPKRIMRSMLVWSALGIFGGGWLVLVFGNVLVPVTALALLVVATLLFVLQRAELDEDRNLRRFVTHTIDHSSRQVLLKDFARLPVFLGASAPQLGIDRFVVYEALSRRRLELRAGDDALFAAIAGHKRKLAGLQRRAVRARQPVDAAALLPDQAGPVRLASLGPSQGETFWLYCVAPGKAQGAALHAASGVAADYRAMQQLRFDLSAGAYFRPTYLPADEWAGRAVTLIANHADQVASGADNLETALMAFHPIGFPVFGNSAMAVLYETLGLSQAETTLPELVAALAEIEPERIATIVCDLLLHGGETRVNCRDLNSRSRLLRIAVAQEARPDRPRTLVVEAQDVSEPRRLERLRQSVSQLLDISVRNDLEALGFALAMLRSDRITPERRERALAQADTAVRRAGLRLDELAPHLQRDALYEGGQAFPIDASSVLRECAERLGGEAGELGITIDFDAPAVSGFTIADPQPLVEMVSAMLQVIVADTPAHETVSLVVTEEDARTRVTISGGIGMAFERLCAALESAGGGGFGPFAAISDGMGKALGWGASVSYSSMIGKGYRFVIDMRRIG